MDRRCRLRGGAAPAADLHFLENRREVDIAYFGAHAHMPLGLALLLAAALGAPLVAVPAAARIIQQRRAARRQSRAPAKSVNRTPTATPELPPKAASQR
jgi:Lipopolysaccharide assembly protein A domain